MLSIPLARRPSRRRVLLAGAAALLAMLALAGTASARPYYWIVNENSGKALQSQNESKDWGTSIVQRNIAPLGAQHWFVKNEGTYAGLTVRSFENRNAHLCIHPSDWSGAAGTRLLQASCTSNNVAARQWVPHYTSGPYDPNGIFYGQRFYMFSMKTWQYAAIAGASQAQDALLVQAPFESNPHFRFRLIYAGET